MRDFSMKLTNVRAEDALQQLEMLVGVNHKQANCLRLLAEEMFSMMGSVLEKDDANFEIASHNGEYSLTLSTRAQINESAKKEFLSVSSSGKNIAYAGFKGKIVAMLEAMATNPEVMPMEFDMPVGDMGYSRAWLMSYYINNVDAETQQKEWDGMEKSIIANFADDVLIGVRADRLEMIVKKAF